MRQEMREEILQAARKLLSERGLPALTMRAVADEIGYSVGAIYEYFSSKDDLCAALFFQGTQGLAGRMERAIAELPPDATPLDRIRAAGLAYRQFAHDHSDLYLLIFTQQSPSGGPPIGDEPDLPESFAMLVDLVRQGRDEGLVPDIDPLEAAAALWAYVHGFVMLELTGNLPPEASDRIFSTGGALFSRGLLESANGNDDITGDE